MTPGNKSVKNDKTFLKRCLSEIEMLIFRLLGSFLVIEGETFSRKLLHCDEFCFDALKVMYFNKGNWIKQQCFLWSSNQASSYFSKLKNTFSFAILISLNSFFLPIKLNIIIKVNDPIALNYHSLHPISWIYLNLGFLPSYIVRCMLTKILNV